MTTPGKLEITILGCGSSGGVPRFGGKDGKGAWGACDPKEPKNRRTRCSILLQRLADDSTSTNVLIDTSPDMRAQLLTAGCAKLDAVVFTHDHADQCHGIDDLRIFALNSRKLMPVYLDEDTSGGIARRFQYCFEQLSGSMYPAILDRKDMPQNCQPFSINGDGGEVQIVPFLQFHGAVNSLGFRIGDTAYSSDVVDLPDESFETLSGVKTWIVDALQYKPHATHAHLEKTLQWIERVQPNLAVLTNLHVHMDYQTLKSELPAGVVPAYDGMKLTGLL